MAKTNAYETDLLELIFNGTTLATLAEDYSGSPAQTNLYVSLHTADPTDAGNQSSSEATYTGYARVAVARTGSPASWVVTGNKVNPASVITFGSPTSGPETITHFGVGTDSTGAGYLLYKGTVSPNIEVSNGGDAPRLTTATNITES